MYIPATGPRDHGIQRVVPHLESYPIWSACNKELRNKDTLN